MKKMDAQKNRHAFVPILGDYDLYCDGKKVCFIPYLVAKNQVVCCPSCKEAANSNYTTNKG